MALTGVYGQVDRADAIAVIRRALDLGIEHFDTAELYGPFTNEELLADALGSDSRYVTIATKFGYRIDDGRIAGLDSRPQTIRPRVEASLRRLKRDAIDLLYQHRPDPEVPVEDVIGVIADLVQAGKVRAVGLSGTSAGLLRRAQAVHRVSAIQNEFSLLAMPDQDLLDLADKSNVTVVAHSPLARGRLAGHVRNAEARPLDDYRRHSKDFSPGALVAASPLLSALQVIAKENDVAPATLAIAWLLKAHPNLIAIPGARSVHQLELCCAASAVELHDADVRRLQVAATSAHA